MAPLSDGIILTHCPLFVSSKFWMLDEIIAPGVVLIDHFFWPSSKISSADNFPSNVETYNKLADKIKTKPFNTNNWIEFIGCIVIYPAFLSICSALSSSQNGNCGCGWSGDDSCAADAPDAQQIINRITNKTIIKISYKNRMFECPPVRQNGLSLRSRTACKWCFEYIPLFRIDLYVVFFSRSLDFALIRCLRQG